MEANSEWSSGSLWRGIWRDSWVGGSKITVHFVTRFGEKAVIGRHVLVGAKSQHFGGSLWRDGSCLETCVGGGNITAVRWLA